jgi:hypothetical protein
VHSKPSHKLLMAESHQLLITTFFVVFISKSYRFSNLDSSGVFFVSRLKDNFKYSILESFLTDKRKEHILSDEDIELIGLTAHKNYPKKLRIVKVYDSENKREMILLTNQLSWSAQTIS